MVILVLIRHESLLQRPVYYASQILKVSEIKYSKVEKVVYALVVTTRKVRPYFYLHLVIVLNILSRSIFTNFGRSKRMQNWGVELAEFDIRFSPRQVIKAQALTDFIIECTIEEDEPSQN